MGVGVPFDPWMGLSLATGFLVAMLFKDKILHRLGGRGFRRMYAFVNEFVPALQIPWEAVHRLTEMVIRSPLDRPPSTPHHAGTVCGKGSPCPR